MPPHRYTLGLCHENGTGVAKNEREAVRLYRIAADQGNATAQKHLGTCYQRGVGVLKDDREAVHWYGGPLLYINNTRLH